jgi:formylglycine-generating enzyme required for sulfatase activity
VTIAKPFAVGIYAVTFDEWDACVSDGGCDGYRPSDNGWGRGMRPVINVSWDDAKRYIAWLSNKTGKVYRLLSETEREYVTRAGTTTAFWWGSAALRRTYQPTSGPYQPMATNSYVQGGSFAEFRKKTVPVDSYDPNPWGLYNVHGNVWDWTDDCWNASNRGNPGDGSARTSGDCGKRVLRGGSWSEIPEDRRAASRSRDSSTVRNDDHGFRVARTLAP